MSNFNYFLAPFLGERTGVVLAANGPDAKRWIDSTAPIRQVQGRQDGRNPIHASLLVP